MLNNILAVAAGGAIGAVFRYINSRIMAHYFKVDMYYATLFVNVVGCFLMGIVYVWFQNKFQASENLRLFLTVGFLGALTTWSTFSMETVVMINSGEFLKGFLYMASTLFLCLMAFYIGIKI